MKTKLLSFLNESCSAWTTDQLEDFVDLLARSGGGASVHPAALAGPEHRY